jgi:hypothetical protein
MKIAICGYGDAGKGTAGQYLASISTLKYTKSTSEAAIDVVWNEWGQHQGYDSSAEMFSDRHNARDIWHRIILDYNQPHGVTLYEKMLPENDILDGIRDSNELSACLKHGLVDLAIWIKRPGFGESRESCTVQERDCHITLLNNAGLMTFQKKLHKLAWSWGLLKCS